MLISGRFKVRYGRLWWVTFLLVIMVLCGTLRSSASVDRGKLPPLSIAVMSRNASEVRSALRQGVDVNAPDGQTGWTALDMAVYNGDLAIVRLLVKHGAGLNERARDGGIPLTVALSEGHADVAFFLINAGADPCLAGDEGLTPTELAISNGLDSILKTLINKGCDVNAIDQSHYTDFAFAPNTALMMAARGGRVYALRLLIAAGATVNLPNKYGDTALHYAAAAGQNATIRVLVASGAIVNTTDHKGKTAMDYAIEQHHRETWALLYWYGLCQSGVIWWIEGAAVVVLGVVVTVVVWRRVRKVA